MICPYCDGDRALMRSTVRTEFKDDSNLFIIVREVYCPECRSVSYAVRSVKDEEKDYRVIRRDELKDRTGIRISRRCISRRVC